MSSTHVRRSRRGMRCRARGGTSQQEEPARQSGLRGRDFNLDEIDHNRWGVRVGIVSKSRSGGACAEPASRPSAPGTPLCAARAKAISLDRTITRVKRLGRRRWKKASGYQRQARVENAVFRYKSIIGDSLRARTPGGRQTETLLACNVLNRMTELGRPASYSIGR